jgi:hypothetical protein
MEKVDKAQNLVDLSVFEVSLVDEPANKGAKVTLFKREDEFMSDKLTQDEIKSFKSIFAKFSDFITGEEKPENKVSKGEEMADSQELQKALTEINTLKTTVADLQKKLSDKEAEVAKVGTLSDVEKSYMDALDEGEKAAFISKSADERKALMTEKPIIKCADGSVLKGLTKDAAAYIADLEKSKKDAADAEMLQKSETEFKNLPGTKEQKLSLYKSLSGLDEETRKYTMDLLKKADGEIAKNFKETGEGGESNDSAEDKLDALAKAYAAEHKTTFAKAYTAVLATEDGRKLYAKYEEGRNNVSKADEASEDDE